MPNTRFVLTIISAFTLFLMMAHGRGQVLAAPQERVLWSFGGPGDGVNPQGSLLDVGGTLYGTTSSGGANNAGTVFELSPPAPGQTAWNERVLWSFGGAGDGFEPVADLIMVSGKLYGTTYFAGQMDSAPCSN